MLVISSTQIDKDEVLRFSYKKNIYNRRKSDVGDGIFPNAFSGSWSTLQLLIVTRTVYCSVFKTRLQQKVILNFEINRR